MGQAKHGDGRGDGSHGKNLKKGRRTRLKFVFVKRRYFSATRTVTHLLFFALKNPIH